MSIRHRSRTTVEHVSQESSKALRWMTPILLWGTAWASVVGAPDCTPLDLHLAQQGPASTPIPAPEGMHWYRFANHTHTYYSSDGHCSVNRRIRGAAAEGADAVVITDHNEIGACSDSDFLPLDGCIPMCGEEYAWGAFDGELGLIGLEPGSHIGGSTVEDVVQSALNVGGVVVVNHPFLGTEPWQYDDLHLGISGIEVWNTFLFIVSSSAEAVEWWNGFLARGKTVFGIGGSDMHNDFPSALKPCNYVLATGAEPTPLKEGIRAGHITISSSSTGPRCFVWCDANGDGTYETPMGSIAQITQDTALRFRVEVYAAETMTLNVITKSGIVGTFTVGTGDPWYVEYTAQANAGVKDFMRAEINTSDPTRPVEAIANPVYVNFTPGDSDSDGLSDAKEMSLGTDHYAADSDADGLSDGFEVNYDGNAAYNPYDPDTNPGGQDLDAHKKDTDGDGASDATEVLLGNNPIDPADGGSLPTRGGPALVTLVLLAALTRVSARPQRI